MNSDSLPPASTMDSTHHSAQRPVRHWVDAGYDLPENGEWVLHTYYGVRPPEYGIFINGRFCRRNGPETFPANHWLRIPFIDMPNVLISHGASEPRAKL